MPKTSRSEQVDMRGLELIADEFTGAFNGTVTLAAVEALSPVATADATDLATAQALANALKTAHNALLAALKA